MQSLRGKSEGPNSAANDALPSGCPAANSSDVSVIFPSLVLPGSLPPLLLVVPPLALPPLLAPPPAEPPLPVVPPLLLLPPVAAFPSSPDPEQPESEAMSPKQAATRKARSAICGRSYHSCGKLRGAGALCLAMQGNLGGCR